MALAGEHGSGDRPTETPGTDASEPVEPGTGEPPARASRSPETLRVGPPGRPALNLVMIVVALVTLAVLKPWGEAGLHAIAPPQRPSIDREPTPIPTPDTSTRGLAEPICLGPITWRVTSLERWRTQGVRVWQAVDPIAGVTDPIDPRVPSVLAAAFDITALGWCAPTFGSRQPVGPAVVDAWLVTGSGTTPVELRRLVPLPGPSEFGALYAPPGPCTSLCGRPADASPRSAPSSWPTGRYVFRYRNAGTGDLWFAVDVLQIPPLPGASSSPETHG
jgi:hypothetical protein